jgi:hypothetical protein
MFKRKLILSIFLLVQIILINVISFFPDFVERYYSNALYVPVSAFLRIVFGNLPFSVGDFLYAVVIILAIRWFYLKRKSWRVDWKINLLHIISFFSVFYFFFHLLWAINYVRTPLSEKMNIATEYTDAELLVFTKKLIAKTNAVHLGITSDKSKRAIVHYTQDQIFEMNISGYRRLAKKYPFFRYEHASTKTSLFSLPLTYMGFSGYLNPFTNEAQVNSMLPMHTFPATAAHEMAHQIGYASESEANFVGFLATVENQDLNIKYSGYMMALNYCLYNWKVRNEKIFDQLKKTVNPGVIANFKESQDFWESYQSFIEALFEVFYDNFLKVNKQEEGLDSYSRFVDLLVNYYKDKAL